MFQATALIATRRTSPTPAPPSAERDNPARLHIHERAETIAAAKRKVLLLEDDPAFKEIMGDFLVESGFEVVAVMNGVEGVHQVLASDFEVILCDMMMPTLPGDMFFRAVERMRPHLCDRFIFMSGHRGNHKVNSFIEGVCGTLLTKPFQVDDLMEMISFVQVRSFLLAA